MWTEMALECGVAGKCAVALAADVAAHACVDLHVLLQSRLRLEALPAQQTEDGHIWSWEQEERDVSMSVWFHLQYSC